jgi:hypothetical protein
MHRTEQRVRRLERRRAAEQSDPREANRIAVECYDRGLPLPDMLTGQDRVIAEAIYCTLRFYDNQWSDEPLPLPALPAAG